jgi:hypothetical protein
MLLDDWEYRPVGNHLFGGAEAPLLSTPKLCAVSFTTLLNQSRLNWCMISHTHNDYLDVKLPANVISRNAVIIYLDASRPNHNSDLATKCLFVYLFVIGGRWCGNVTRYARTLSTPKPIFLPTPLELGCFIPSLDYLLARAGLCV